MVTSIDQLIVVINVQISGFNIILRLWNNKDLHVLKMIILISKKKSNRDSLKTINWKYYSIKIRLRRKKKSLNNYLGMIQATVKN